MKQDGSFVEGSEMEQNQVFSSTSNSSAMLANCVRAACRFSVISRASTSGAGRVALSSRASSLSQKMSRFILSRASSWGSS